MVMGSTGLRPENDCAGEGQQELQSVSFSCQRGCYIRTITPRVQLEHKITGRESQGAWASRRIFRRETASRKVTLTLILIQETKIQWEGSTEAEEIPSSEALLRNDRLENWECFSCCKKLVRVFIIGAISICVEV
jgi:hypothetical protein